MIHRSDSLRRYLQLGLLVLAGGAIYPLLYLRQNFETSILHSFHITAAQLSELYAVLGMIYVLTYAPSGWLADRISPRFLMGFSLATVGVLGLWFSTFPDYGSLQIIFLGWGLSAGLTFWAALIKGVKLLAKPQEQGRFFGILDGGRGLVEAVLASLALALFAYTTDAASGDNTVALKNVIYLYSGTCLAVAVFIFFVLPSQRPTADAKDKSAEQGGGLIADLLLLLRIPAVWVMAFIVFTGYQLFWATYSFSAYLQQSYGLTALAAGTLTVIKLWMRPIGGIGGGFLADRFSRHGVLGSVMVVSALGLLALILMPRSVNVYALLGLVMLIGCMTYAIRGLYWSILDDCGVPTRIVGLAIGLISFLGYLPDLVLPAVNAWLLNRYDPETTFQLYFGYIVLWGLLGAVATVYFGRLTQKKRSVSR